MRQDFAATWSLRTLEVMSSDPDVFPLSGRTMSVFARTKAAQAARQARVAPYHGGGGRVSGWQGEAVVPSLVARVSAPAARAIHRAMLEVRGALPNPSSLSVAHPGAMHVTVGYLPNWVPAEHPGVSPQDFYADAIDGIGEVVGGLSPFSLRLRGLSVIGKVIACRGMGSERGGDISQINEAKAALVEANVPGIARGASPYLDPAADVEPTGGLSGWGHTVHASVGVFLDDTLAGAEVDAALRGRRVDPDVSFSVNRFYLVGMGHDGGFTYPRTLIAGFQLGEGRIPAVGKHGGTFEYPWSPTADGTGTFGRGRAALGPSFDGGASLT